MTDKFRLLLDDARNDAALGLSGRKIEIVGASDADALVQLRVVYASGITRSYYDYQEEYKSRSSEPFINVYCTHTAQAGAWMDILVTADDEEWVYERRTDLEISSISEPVDVSSADALATDDDNSIAAGAAEIVAAANVNRVELMLSNPAANNDPFRVGDEDVDATRGIELNPGQTITLRTTAEVSAYNTGAGAQSICIMEIVR